MNVVARHAICDASGAQLDYVSNGIGQLPRVLNHRLDHLGGDGPAQQVPLNFIDGVVTEQLELVVILNTLSDDPYTHRMRHVDQGLHDLLVVVVAADILDEPAIDLEAIDRQGFQVVQRRVTGAEIVDRDGDAARV